MMNTICKHRLLPSLVVWTLYSVCTQYLCGGAGVWGASCFSPFLLIICFSFSFRIHDHALGVTEPSPPENKTGPGHMPPTSTGFEAIKTAGK